LVRHLRMKPQDRTILVTGATGAQGGGTVDALLAEGFCARALVRDPRSAAACALGDKGVELAQGNFDDSASLQAAMQGAYGVFSMQNVSPPDDIGAEVRHGAKLVEAALAAGVEVFVHTSVARAGRQTEFVGWSKGRWNEAYWNAKSAVIDLVRASGLPGWVILKPAYMFDNFLPPKVAFMYPSFAGRVIETAMGPDVRLDMLSAKDLGRFAAAAFVDSSRFLGEEIDLAAASVTMPEMAQYIGEASGHKVKAIFQQPETLIAKGYLPGVVDNQIWATAEGYRVDLDHAASFGVPFESPAAWANRNREHFRFP
jgi:uncharacterized protein YbjT (DUF2867 family)